MASTSAGVTPQPEQSGPSSVGPSAPPLSDHYEPPPAYNEVMSSKNDKGASVYPALPPHTIPETSNYPFPPSMPPMHPTTQHPNPIVIMQGGPRPQQVCLTSMQFNAHSTDVTCPFCHHAIKTKRNTKAGLLTWLLCGGLAFFGCWVCCCIPFCVDSCQDVEHSCPKCGRFLGTYRRI